MKVVMRERTGRKPCLVEVSKAEMGDLMQWARGCGLQRGGGGEEGYLLRPIRG